jgi:histidine triad (HIT) family protein
VTQSPGCVFCRIIAGEVAAARVYEDDRVVVFLDNSPLFHGHCLVVPRLHYDTLLDVPGELLQPLMNVVQLLGRAAERGLGADGSFVAVNNKVSQSVPHLHVHVIPRRKGDGMKGFFWPRHPYRDNSQLEEFRMRIEDAIRDLKQEMAGLGG